MPRRGDDDQVQREPILRALQHPKRLAKAQVPQDIHSQVATPVAHILRPAPPLLLRHDPGVPPYTIHHPPGPIIRPRPDNLAERPRVGEHVPLHLLDSIIRERLRQHAPLPPVQLPVPRVVRVRRGVHERVVEVRLADVRAVGVDGAERGGGVEGEGVGPEADDGAFACLVLARCVVFPTDWVSWVAAGERRALTISLVQPPELEVPVALVSVVRLVRVRDLGEPRAGVLC